MSSTKPVLTFDKGLLRFHTVRHTLGTTFIGRQIESVLHHVSDIPWTSRIWKGAHFCALATAAIGFLGLLGWLGNIPVLAQGYRGSVLIAPRAAVLFLCVGAALLYYLQKPDSARAKWCLVMAGIVSVGISLLNKSPLPIMTSLLRPMLLPWP